MRGVCLRGQEKVVNYLLRQIAASAGLLKVNGKDLSQFSRRPWEGEERGAGLNELSGRGERRLPFSFVLCKAASPWAIACVFCMHKLRGGRYDIFVAFFRWPSKRGRITRGSGPTWAHNRWSILVFSSFISALMTKHNHKKFFEHKIFILVSSIACCCPKIVNWL